MESNRNHLFEYKSGRLNIQDIGFNGPGSEAFRLDLLLNRDCDILVPRTFQLTSGILSKSIPCTAKDPGPRTASTSLRTTSELASSRISNDVYRRLRTAKVAPRFRKEPDSPILSRVSDRILLVSQRSTSAERR